MFAISRPFLFLLVLLTFLSAANAQSTKQILPGDKLREVPSSSEEVKLSFASIVKRTAPAVVNVYASRMVQQRRSPFAGDPFFERFFGNKGFGQSKPRLKNDLGSGVIIDESGIVVTNFHVIRNAIGVKVALSDRREFTADIILKDQKSDLAILKLQADGERFPALDFASQSSLEVGDLVLAIGNPFGVGQTVTQGIISALARTPQADISNSNFFLQTDAAINPGNSGGALVDMNGAIVGINTAIFSRSGGSNGIGFAIPSDMVETVVKSALRGSARVERPWVGARFQNIDADSALALGLFRPSGVLVTDIYDEGPADAAGISVGDLIVAVNKKPFDDLNGFNYHLATLGIDKTADLTISRDGKKRFVKVNLITAPETVPRDERLISGRHPLAGVTIANLSPALAEELRFSGPVNGVIIRSVDRRSRAWRLGLRRNDIILSFNDKQVRSTRQLVRIATGQQSFWQLSINRAGKILESNGNRG